ncbi:uncharacterized protein A1O5_04330 [Cladophialophora psammophila CBS 110553]|uniref:Aminoglycoside phosphotransferase domain-containing protein n=1 Tax=Cladophialophora psammophila CBS 110553 TaxID=1182543 RepID=W9XNC9_9EURO|nr:uncharacterized protein A1O5_04330 [Cladophialophora psammophila CBS 110553]EXJ71829.1 hypothetical protein A1O5_04330 [Cladophialophora psammophila CBS 110553]
MKIVPASQTLSLILKTFQDTIVPTLQTAETKDAANLIQTALSDLLRRQGPGFDLLQKCLDLGHSLRIEILEFLIAHGKTQPSVPNGISNGHAAAPGDFETLASAHSKLTHEIETLCIELSSIREPETGDLLRKAAHWEAEYYKLISQTTVVPFEESVNGAEENKAQGLSSEFLQTLMSERHGPLEIESFSSLPGGYGGKQTYFTTVVYADGRREELVIRKTGPVPPVTHSNFNLEEEYSFLRCLAETDFPAPHPIELFIKDSRLDGSFYTMNRLPGKVPGTWLGGGSEKVSEEVLFQLAELLAKLHRTPTKVFAEHVERYETPDSVTETISDRYRGLLKAWKKYAAEVEHLPSPFTEWLFHWLESHIPHDDRSPVPIHGDFFVHNTLVNEEGRITSVLDWECADLAAPEQDIAYVQPHVIKHMDWDKFVAHYLASGGQKLNQESFGFCFAFAIMRIFLAGNRSSLNLQRGINRDLRFVMMELGFAGALMQMGLNCTQ